MFLKKNKKIIYHLEQNKNSYKLLQTHYSNSNDVLSNSTVQSRPAYLNITWTCQYFCHMSQLSSKKKHVLDIQKIALDYNRIMEL